MRRAGGRRRRAAGGQRAGGDPAGRAATSWYDFEAKYLDDACEFDIPADLPDAVDRRAAGAGVPGVHRAGLRRAGPGRLLRRVRADVLTVNEVNTMPGFTPISMFPRMWAASGLDYPDAAGPAGPHRAAPRHRAALSPSAAGARDGAGGVSPGRGRGGRRRGETAGDSRAAGRGVVGRGEHLDVDRPVDRRSRRVVDPRRSANQVDAVDDQRVRGGDEARPAGRRRSAARPAARPRPRRPATRRVDRPAPAGRRAWSAAPRSAPGSRLRARRTAPAARRPATGARRRRRAATRRRPGRGAGSRPGRRRSSPTAVTGTATSGGHARRRAAVAGSGRRSAGAAPRPT